MIQVHVSVMDVEVRLLSGAIITRKMTRNTAKTLLKQRNAQWGHSLVFAVFFHCARIFGATFAIPLLKAAK